MLWFSDRLENSYILDMKEWFLSIHHPYRVEFGVQFPAVTRGWNKAFFTKLRHLYPLSHYSKVCATLHLVSKCQIGMRYQHFHFFLFHHGQNSMVHGNSDLLFFFIRKTELITPIRDGRVDTDLVHRMNFLKQGFRVPRISIEVNGTFTSSLLQEPATQGTGTYEDKMTSFFAFMLYVNYNVLMTRADGIGLAMTLGLVSTPRCTPTLSVPWEFRCVQYIRLNGIYLKPLLSLAWALIQQIHVSCTRTQTLIAHHAQQQLWPLNYIRRVALTRRKTTKTPRLDYTSRFVHVIPTFSQHCHKTVT